MIDKTRTLCGLTGWDTTACQPHLIRHPIYGVLHRTDTRHRLANLNLTIRKFTHYTLSHCHSKRHSVTHNGCDSLNLVH